MAMQVVVTRSTPLDSTPSRSSHHSMHPRASGCRHFPMLLLDFPGPKDPSHRSNSILLLFVAVLLVPPMPLVVLMPSPAQSSALVPQTSPEPSSHARSRQSSASKTSGAPALLLSRQLLCLLPRPFHQFPRRLSLRLLPSTRHSPPFPPSIPQVVSPPVCYSRFDYFPSSGVLPGLSRPASHQIASSFRLRWCSSSCFNVDYQSRFVPTELVYAEERAPV